MGDRRIHGPEAAGGGDIDGIEEGPVLGPCPGCGAELCAGHARNPATQRIERVVLHPMPFCTYFGETSPEDIERTINAAQKRS